MDQNERAEVREMMHDILSGWQAQTVAREELTNYTLKNIDKHLARLNGSVARHEQKINENLPHTTANCAQRNVIEQIRDNMISSKAMRKTIIVSITATASIFSAFFVLYQIFWK